MRYLLCRTDGIGDLVVSLPIQSCILDADPAAKVFWLVRPVVAPILDHLPGVSGVLHRPLDDDLENYLRGQLPLREYRTVQRRRPHDPALERLIGDVRPDVLLALYHRDMRIIPAARRAGVPIMVARPRGWRQSIGATHLVWARKSDSRRHESQHGLDFLRAIKWPVPDTVPPPRLALTQEERARGLAELAGVPAPRLALVVSGKTAGARPSPQWWGTMTDASKKAGWSPVVLSPPDKCGLPPTDLRGLMARLAACDAVLGVSTGPTHLAAALGVPTLCLMYKNPFAGPARWAPLGDRAVGLVCPSDEDDEDVAMDSFSPDVVLEHLKQLVGRAMG